MNYAWFIKVVTIPSTTKEVKYTQWQEGVRKDIERAFDNLKLLWKSVSCPIQIWNLLDIVNWIMTALILHNFVVDCIVVDI